MANHTKYDGKKPDKSSAGAKHFLMKLRKYIDSKCNMQFYDSEGCKVDRQEDACWVEIELDCSTVTLYTNKPCSHYHAVTKEPFDPLCLPEKPMIDPCLNPKVQDKKDCDTLHICHPNGNCFYTCCDGEWVLDFCKTDCCHYQIGTGATLDPSDPPQTPVVGTPSDVTPGPGDTLHEIHDNGSCYYTFTNGEWVLDSCVPTCCTPPVEIPADAFADPANPTEDEVNTWLAANHPGLPPGTDILYVGDGDAGNPDYVWTANGDDTAHNIESPDCCVLPVEIPADAFADPANPTEDEVNTWLAANHPGLPPGTDILYVGDGDAGNPDYVWTANGDDTAHNIESPDCCVPPVEIPADAFADPANPTEDEVNTWLAANHPGLPPGTDILYVGDGDAGNPDYVWTANGDDTAHNIESPDCCVLPVEIPADAFADPANPTEDEVNTWLAANHPGLPPGTDILYVGDGDAGNPDYVWTANGDDTAHNIESPDCCVPPVEIPADAFADPANPTEDEVNTWLAANHLGLPPGTDILYVGDGDAGNPDYVWTANGDDTAHNIESPDCCVLPVEIPADAFADPANPTEDEVNTWLAANHPGLPPGTDILYVGDGDAGNPDYVWTANGDDTAHNIESPDCCVLPVEIPADAFADPANPTEDEVNTWLAANHPGLPPGTDILYVGDGDAGNPDYVWTANGDDTAHNVDAPSLNVTSVNNNGTITATLPDGTPCDLSTQYVETTDDCYHYVVDSKTGVIVSNYCVEKEPTAFCQDLNFSNDLYDDLAAATGGSVIAGFALDAWQNVPTTGWLAVGPYEIEMTNESSCGPLICHLTSRLGSIRFTGAAGLAFVSYLGTFGVNSPTAGLDIGKTEDADPTKRECHAQVNGLSSSFCYQLNPGFTRSHTVIPRYRRADDYISTEAQLALGNHNVLSLDTHRLTLSCHAAKPRSA